MPPALPVDRRVLFARHCLDLFPSCRIVCLCPPDNNDYDGGDGGDGGDGDGGDGGGGGGGEDDDDDGPSGCMLSWCDGARKGLTICV